jgi:hypothetical protein
LIGISPGLFQSEESWHGKPEGGLSECWDDFFHRVIFWDFEMAGPIEVTTSSVLEVAASRKPSITQKDLKGYVAFTQEYGERK